MSHLDSDYFAIIAIIVKMFLIKKNTNLIGFTKILWKDENLIKLEIPDLFFLNLLRKLYRKFLWKKQIRYFLYIPKNVWKWVIPYDSELFKKLFFVETFFFFEEKKTSLWCLHDQESTLTNKLFLHTQTWCSPKYCK